MDYKPVTGVWEITMACNMRCKHCGSSCTSPLPDELTTDEALSVCDQLGEMGVSWITLSGGEPLTRPDWPIIAKRLRENHIIPNIITNGWLFNEQILDQAEAAGVDTIAISLDGLEKTHDFIRREGSYQKTIQAYKMMRKRKITSAAITTITQLNIHELPALKDILSELDLVTWQVQIGIPMGNLAERKDLIIPPEDVDTVINFAYDVMKENKIRICLADCLGYYNLKEIEVRKIIAATDDYAYEWKGCHAGKYSMGILHNGDILGCTSIRDRKFIEGNIRKTPLKDIWNNPENFAWNRNMHKSQLSGFCQICKYGNYCLGGCPNSRLTMEGSIYQENRYCSYHVAMKKIAKKVQPVEDVAELLSRARRFIDEKQYQIAEIFISKILGRDPAHVEALQLAGLIHYMLENYQHAREINEKVLSINTNDVYANKGLGLSLAKLGYAEEGIKYLEKSVRLTDDSYLDPFYDLALTLAENDRKAEAFEILKRGREKSPEFVKKSDGLFQLLTK